MYGIFNIMSSIFNIRNVYRIDQQFQNIKFSDTIQESRPYSNEFSAVQYAMSTTTSPLPRISGKTLDLVFWAVLFLCLAPTRSAHAYLDPGTGSYMIQIAIGVVFGGVYAVRGFFRRTFSSFKKPAQKQSKSDE
jgi:succinate dehydrogenase/fumarate reductase cytochrome b subunit